MKKTSGEVIVANENGAVKVKVARTIRRVPAEAKWQVGNLEWVKHVPWSLEREDKQTDGNTAEFDFENGLRAAMTREEVEEVGHQVHRCGNRIQHTYSRRTSRNMGTQTGAEDAVRC